MSDITHVFQVTVPPVFRQALVGLNFRLLVASMVTVDWALAAVQEPELPDPLLAAVDWELGWPGMGPVPHADRRRAIPPTAIPIRLEYLRA